MAQRGYWDSQYEFLFSVLGCMVGLGNVWRFPYLCYKNGGGAFLIPYFIFMFLCAMPIFFLEMAYTQFSNLGPGKAWICVPILRGIGYGMVIMTGIVAVYYTVIMAWTLYYLVMSFSKVLPWSHCDNEWNNDACALRVNQNMTSLMSSGFNNFTNESNIDSTVTLHHDGINSTELSTRIARTPTEQFWEYNVLQLSDGIGTAGAVRWPLLLCLFCAWLIVFLTLIKGIKSSGKVMYVAATVPYLLLLVLLVRGATLPGALDGVMYYAVPKWEYLLKFSVWRDAAVQMFYSAGMGWGGISTLASYNRFHNNIERDAILLPILDVLTSFFAGFVIFVNLGYMSHVSGIPIDQVVKQGPGIAFMVYPEALSQLPLPQLWSVLFFLMLFTVGLDSQMVHVQTVTCAIIDTFPKQLINRKLIVTGSVCFVMFLLGISCVTQGGIYVLQILDWYCASIAVMFLAFLEVVGLSWMYGLQNFYNDIELMLGRSLSPFWGIFWRFITPAIILLIWIMNLVQLSPVTYGSYTYPGWAVGIGWIVAFLAIVPVFIWIPYELKGHTGNILTRLGKSLQPTPEWGPADDDQKEKYKGATYENGGKDVHAMEKESFIG
ncbi:sodium- and chloride-dependent glycine transporter 2-like isoform X2 [Mya arenaria]|uniref:sodium- and chloride-dependent glycine transporter 2-like isoform X2 n=1 Tax=Mya arenaria TaxID=6604 RepID=UPI0022E52943|nr:sodium- and chloride-dependent glycine transporter 2-like isoform X2 [Mya arenaria]